MSKSIILSKVQITEILSCINERESLYLKEIELKKDDKTEVLMVKGYKKHIAIIKDIQEIFGYKPFPGR